MFRRYLPRANALVLIVLLISLLGAVPAGARSAPDVEVKEFVQAVVALGAPHRRIIFRHLIPNLLGPIIVYSTLTVPAVMLEEAFLSFLGLGVQPPNSSWGLLAAEGASAITAINTAWWLIFFPGLALALTLAPSALPLAAQQAHVNLDWDPQRNTAGLKPFATRLVSPEVHDDRTVTFRVPAPEATEVAL